MSKPRLQVITASTRDGRKHIDEERGTFSPGEVQEKASRVMLDELGRWAEALAGLRGG